MLTVSQATAPPIVIKFSKCLVSPIMAGDLAFLYFNQQNNDKLLSSVCCFDDLLTMFPIKYHGRSCYKQEELAKDILKSSCNVYITHNAITD